MAEDDVIRTLPRRSWFDLGQFSQWLPTGTFCGAFAALHALVSRGDLELVRDRTWQYRLTDSGRKRQDAIRGGGATC